MMAQAENHGSSRSKYLNLAIWIAIVLVTVLIAAVTVWASHQQNLGSMWDPE